MANALILNPLQLAAVGCSNPAVGYLPSYLGNDHAGVVLRTAPGDGTVLTFDLGADTPIDTVMLFGLSGSVAAATAGVRVSLATAGQGDAFNGTPQVNYWLDPSTLRPFVTDAPIATGNGVFLWQAPAGAPAQARYVRLNVAGLGPAGYLQASRAVIGRAIRLERNFGMGGSFGVRDLGSVDFSARGVLLRRRGRKLRTASLTFANIRRDEVVAKTRPLLEQIGNTEMIALITDPGATDVAQGCYFGPLVGDLTHTQRNAVAWEAKTNIVSIF